MHIYFSGIGGAGIGPLALIAHQAGFTVSGSDKQNSSYIDYLKNKGITNIHIGQTTESIDKVNKDNPIDWLVYTSALTLENEHPEEILYCQSRDIKVSKRDQFLKKILEEKQLKLIAIAGTHGKTTTTAMTIWLMKNLDQPISYLLPAKTSFADMGKYEPNSDYFIYEADEFDYNFLAFEPKLSLISGVSYDHHEIFKTKEEYKKAFRTFISQSSSTYMWRSDYDYLYDKTAPGKINVLSEDLAVINQLKIKGLYNRYDGLLSASAVSDLTSKKLSQLIEVMNSFPGLSRRMEEIYPGLYSDYAHTPEKIKGALSAAKEIAAENNQKLVVIYEPLTNRRQHYILDDYKDCFNGADKVYWLPSYLAREDQNQAVLSPEQLISHLADPSIAEAKTRDDNLAEIVRRHLDSGDMVVCMAGGGGNSLDDWVRDLFY